jgi:dTDP-4-amino-4,6-dideoxygalactose transaminase
MPDLVVRLSHAESKELRALASADGMSEAECAAAAISAALRNRYELRKGNAQVLPFKGLKSTTTGEGE